ncbi:MAG TPA: carboxypeptidase-like regulatory domain-containing protein [Gemmatimonadales bacterium]|nr:carboxypeptidase-like regulatory domain-containing protein [Gemmatimonadales bacterium]
MRRRIASAIALAVVSAGAARAQSPSNLGLRGSIVSAESQQPLGFSIVTLHPGGAGQFTDAAGAFAFTDARPGTYLLSVRQIGYAPLDTQVVIGAHEPVMRIALRRLAIELPPVTITPNPCTKPGRPDSSDAALRAVFDQLQENARRFELLADSYPFRYTLEIADRAVNQRGDTGRPMVRNLEFSSRHVPSYAVGGVVGPSYPPWDPGSLVIETGGPEYFVNPSFVANHCFHLVGRDVIAGEPLVRVDFEPSARLWSADLSGAAFLDSLTYELRYIEVALTHPERTELDGVRSMNARTKFRNIAPAVPLQDSMVAVTTYRFRRDSRVQTQRTLNVRFLRRRPAP